MSDDFEGRVIAGKHCVPATIVANALGISPQNLRTTGLKAVRRESGMAWYALEDLVAMLEARQPGAPDSKDRFADLKAQGLELDLAQRRGELAQKSSLQGAAEAVCAEFRARFGAIGHAIAAQVVSAGSEVEAAGIIQSALDDALAPIAELGFEFSGAADVRAPAEGRAANGSGVGGPQ